MNQNSFPRYSNVIKKLIFLLLTFSAIHSEGQNKRWFAEAWINPVVYSVADYGVRESGLGYYDFYIQQPISQEIGIMLGRQYPSKWDWGLGVSYKKNRQNYGYSLTVPSEESTLLEKIEHSHQVGFIGLRAFAGYSFNKHSIRLIMEMNTPNNIRQSFEAPSSYTIRGFLYNGQTARLKIEEAFNIESSNSLDYIIPELRYAFMLRPDIQILGGVKWKMFGNQEHYRLSIEGNTFEVPEPNTVFNDVRILNRYLMLYAGLSYRIHWGK